MKKEVIKGFLFLLLGILSTSCQKENDISDEQIQEILENVDHVIHAVSDIYSSAETLDSMALHLDEIGAMANVEEVWVEDNAIGIKIKNGGVITWNYFDNDTSEFDTDTSLLENLGMVEFKGDMTIGVCEKKEACISISKVAYFQQIINEIKQSLEERDFSVRLVTSNDFTPQFICEEMPNYGVNIILAHGNYNEKTGVHCIITGVEYKKADFKKVFADWIDNGLEIAAVKEVRNGKVVIIEYLSVTEKLIDKKMTKKFPKNSFMFTAVCSTLKGDTNENIGKVLVGKKKLGCYFGYDGVVMPGRSDKSDLKKIMGYMLNEGYTARNARAKVGSGTNPKLKLIIPVNRDVMLWECDCTLTSGDWVDLGLPSGLLWATRNVGASSPTDYGNHYAWGETSPKSVYSRGTYRYFRCDENSCGLTKYCSNPIFGYLSFQDGLTTLQFGDDAAAANYGGRTPTKAEWEELVNNTTSKWVTINGVRGMCFTGSNGNSFFLPSTGFRNDSSLYVRGGGYYWSSSLHMDYPDDAWDFDSDYPGHILKHDRTYGLPVRAVRQP